MVADGPGEDGKGKIVWVGAGEGNGRNSSSWGNGMYRSVDGGSSWEHLGLTETHDIPRIAVDPRDPDVCYVAALGHLWGANPERGIYKTSDGGKSWDHVLKVDDCYRRFRCSDRPRQSGYGVRRAVCAEAGHVGFFRQQ